MRLLTLIALLAVGQSALALNVKPGTYLSETCRAEVTLTNDFELEDGTVIAGRNRVEISSIGPQNTLRGEIIVMTAEEGQIMDGPGLCMDKSTMGSKVGVDISTGGVGRDDGSRDLRLSCGGKRSNIELLAYIRLGSDNTLISFSEFSKTKSGLFGRKKERTMDCGNLKLIEAASAESVN
ncbi:MAG: hypothetical protein V4692_13840 [Bdellovibrionota bacterium]